MYRARLAVRNHHAIVERSRIDLRRSQLGLQFLADRVARLMGRKPDQHAGRRPGGAAVGAPPHEDILIGPVPFARAALAIREHRPARGDHEAGNAERRVAPIPRLEEIGLFQERLGGARIRSPQGEESHSARKQPPKTHAEGAMKVHVVIPRSAWLGEAITDCRWILLRAPALSGQVKHDHRTAPPHARTTPRGVVFHGSGRSRHRGGFRADPRTLGSATLFRPHRAAAAVLG